MTLSTIARYDPARTPERGDHAVVVGASMAGLCAARVLADAFARVTVVERDPLPDEPTVRRGVPQASHIHVLQESGRATLEDLFPGFGEELLASGGLLLDAGEDVRFHMAGDFLAGGRSRQEIYSATRPLYEHVVRGRVAAIDGVRLRGNCRVTDYQFDERRGAVDGVVLEPAEGEKETLETDLVVDATGRTSHTPQWLDSHGYPEPPTDEVRIDVAYSTTFLDRPAGDRRGVLVVPSSGAPRGGSVVPVEGERWLMTLFGVHGNGPPADPDGLEAFADRLPVPHLSRLLDGHARLGEVGHYPFPSSRRRRYESLERFPTGLVVLGDAMASFNPIYGQGMSVAALEAVQLHHALSTGGLENLAPRFFDRAAETVDVAWRLAVGGDYQFAETEGHKPRGADLTNWYVDRLLQAAQDDPRLFDAFLQVQTMQEPPKSLLRPQVVWRVLGPS